MSKQCNKNKKAHLYAGGGMDIGGMALGTMQFADGLMSYGKERKANEELYNNAIDNTRVGFNGLSSINNLDDLESQLSNYDQLHEIGTSDLIGNDANRLGKYLSVSSQAAQAGGASGNAFGFLAGSIIGQLGAGWMSRRNKKKAERAVDDINQRVRDTNELYTSMADNRLNNIMQNQMAENEWNYIAALGGNLHSNSTTWDNGLNYIGAGGSHESNPNDGVAISTAPDGLQNKVEEGEVVWNDDYVFSRRLKVPKKDLEKNKWKGETYADIAKKLMDESAERPNDPITLRGLDDSLSRLKDSQEELKAKQEGNKIKKEIASMPPELLAQIQQQAQQPTEEEVAQQAAMEQQQMPMVDPSMQQPTMEQPPMYAKGGHLFFGGGNGLGVSVDYTTGNSPINSYGSKSQRPFSIYGNSLQQTFNPSDTVSADMSGKYGSVGQNIQANSNGFSNPTLQGETKTSSGNGINKGAMFQGIAQGIDMIGAGFQSAGYKGGDLNALYKGTKHKDMFGDNMHKAMNGYLNIGLMPSMFSKGGHLFNNAGDVKAVSGKGYFPPLPQPRVERIGYQNLPSVNEINAVKNAALTDYINRQSEYVNVKDAQRYGGFYNNINKVNEYLNGNTPMNVNNIAQGVANQQSKEAGKVYLGRVPVKKNYGLDENSSILDRDNSESVNFFLKKNPNLNLDSDTIYFYSKDKNDEVDKNKVLKADKVNQEIYDKNSVENVSRISGINFDRSNMKAKGGHLHAENPYIWNDHNPVISDIENYLTSQDLIRAAYVNDILENEDNNINYNENRRLDNLIDNARLDLIDKAVSDKINNSDKKSKKDKKESKDRNFNFDPTYMRYAPVLGSIFNVARSIASRPDYGNPERIERAAARIGAQVSPKYIGDYLRYRPLDEAYYLNQLNAQQNAANNAIVGLSNGNRSMALASMLANDYNYNNQRGNAYRQGLEYNDANKLRFGEFNRGTNQFNAQQYLAAAEQNARNRAQAANLIASAAQMREGIDNAYGASQSANWTNLFNNIGNVGRDEMNRNMTKDLYDYYIGRNGMTGFKGTNAKRGGYLTIKTNNRRKE